MELKRAHQLEKIRIACRERGLALGDQVRLWDVEQLIGLGGFKWNSDKDRIESQCAETVKFIALRCLGDK